MVKAEVAPGAGSGGPAFLGPELGSCIVPSTPSGLRVDGLRHTRSYTVRGYDLERSLAIRVTYETIILDARKGSCTSHLPMGGGTLASLKVLQSYTCRIIP